MSNDFVINVATQSAGVTAQGFGTILALVSDDVELKLVENVKDSGVKDGTPAYELLNTLFSQNPRPNKVLVYGKKSEMGAEQLDAVLESTNDFFFITADSNVADVALAKKVEALEKMLFVTARTSETALELAESGFENTHVVYHNLEDEYPAEALAVHMSYNVGGKTARYVQLQGVKPCKEDALVLAELLDANVGTYTTKMGNNQTTEGKVLSGEWTDVVLGGYWVKFNAEQEVNNLAVAVDKIPFTNEGIGMLAGVIGTVMAGAEDQGILEGYTLDYRKAEDVPAEDKAKRHYKYLRATGQLQGAIHSGPINIALVYDEVIANE